MIIVLCSYFPFFLFIFKCKRRLKCENDQKVISKSDVASAHVAYKCVKFKNELNSLWCFRNESGRWGKKDWENSFLFICNISRMKHTHREREREREIKLMQYVSAVDDDRFSILIENDILPPSPCPSYDTTVNNTE